MEGQVRCVCGESMCLCRLCGGMLCERGWGLVGVGARCTYADHSKNSKPTRNVDITRAYRRRTVVVIRRVSRITSAFYCMYVRPSVPIDVQGNPCSNPEICEGGWCHPDNSTAGYHCDCFTNETGTYGKDCHAGVNCNCQPLAAPECPICDGDNETHCDSLIEWKRCPQNDPVCEAEEHRNSNGDVYRFRRVCKQKQACLARTLGPGAKVCDVVAQNNNICRWCFVGRCIDTACPPDQNLWCFTCHARNDVACWISGKYEKCANTDTCFHKYHLKTDNQRAGVWRGCKPQDYCPEKAKGFGNYLCMQNNTVCENCDCSYGNMNPPQPQQPRHRCKPPYYGVCECHGDPHCCGYDKWKFELSDVACWHLFTRDSCINGTVSGDPTFRVYIRIRPRAPPHENRCSVDGVIIQYGNSILSMDRTSGQFIINNGNAANFQIVIGPDPPPALIADTPFSYYYRPTTVRIFVPNAVSYQVNWDFYKAVSVWAPNNTMETLCGLCGDFDGDEISGEYLVGPSDDSKDHLCPTLPLEPNREGLKANNLNEFGMSWYYQNSHYDECKADCQAG